MLPTQTSYVAIEDYAVIGNCHTAALISRDGSIDWWCPMRFDRPAVFLALLDTEKGGRFSIRPRQRYQVTRRYVEHTNVLEATFQTPNGQCRLTDLMPLGVTNRPRTLQPCHAILRMVEGVSGEVEMELVYEPRFAYGRVRPRLYDRKRLGFWCTHAGEALTLYSDLPLNLVQEESRVVGHFLVRPGDQRFAGLSFARGEPLILPPLGEDARVLVERTVAWWQSWTARCAYEGPFREAVLRSALVLKLMTYAPSGAIVAAPTTSLPEEIGGSRNWDYRYCWLRDATLTIRALLELGYRDEARAFISWLLHTTHLTWPKLRVLYDLFGHADIDEHHLDHLSGYRHSRPVRVGNKAVEQLQLDVYGEVIGAVHEFTIRGGYLAKRQLRQLRQLGETVCQHWREPDAGIWEIRSGPQHHVHSKVMCWRALDNLLTIHAHGHLNIPADRFRAVRDAIADAIEAEGYSENVQSYVQAFGNQVADASLLRLPAQGYVQADASRMRSTYDYLEAQLCQNGLWYRYPPNDGDGLSGSEGAFGICSFWAAEYLAQRGETEAAQDVFKRVLACANDLGLFAEEMAPETGAARGNFPQGFTHIGLINAALALSPRHR